MHVATLRHPQKFLSSPSSPDIERENPFRDAMLKFAALEKKVKEKEEEEKRESMERRMSNRATETSAPPSQVISL